jgi:DNA-binding XRE family transcriptional regulator
MTDAGYSPVAHPLFTVLPATPCSGAFVAKYACLLSPHQKGNRLPNIAVVLKAEISRLARKEASQQIRGLKKTALHYRRDIAALRRDLASLHSRMAGLERRTRANVAGGVAEPEAKPLRFSAKGVRAHRTALGLSAADYGLLLGVTGNTIYMWENRTVRPRQEKLAAIASIRVFGKRQALARIEEIRKQASGKRNKGR